jgi:hypothetical protein
MQSDRTIDRFNVDYKGNDGQAIFEALETLVRGELVELGRNLWSGLLRISSVLGNDEIVSLLIDDLDSIDLDNICRRLDFHSLLGVCDEAEIEFAASHFTELDEESLRQLPISVLESILGCQSLRLKDEDSLLRFLNTIRCDREILYRYLKSEYLSCEGIRLLVESLRIDSLDCMIWSCLCHRLFLRVCEMPSESVTISNLRFLNSRRRNVPFVDAFPFNGIIASLTEECGGNIHTNGIVNISSSSDSCNHCWQVADHGWVSYWNSANEPNSWISFDFKDRLVCLSHYTLKSHPYSDNFFLEWVIEGSNDCAAWTELDHRSTRDLLGRSLVKTYECQKASSTEFRYLRMRQTGRTSQNEHYLILTNMEFFGLLVGPQ